jgi:hypothetical protein
MSIDAIAFFVGIACGASGIEEVRGRSSAKLHRALLFEILHGAVLLYACIRVFLLGCGFFFGVLQVLNILINNTTSLHCFAQIVGLHEPTSVLEIVPFE